MGRKSMALLILHLMRPAGSGEAQPMLVSQHPRLWLSPCGSVSPLHYDSATSFLTQARAPVLHRV